MKKSLELPAPNLPKARTTRAMRLPYFYIHLHHAHPCFLSSDASIQQLERLVSGAPMFADTTPKDDFTFGQHDVPSAPPAFDSSLRIDAPALLQVPVVSKLNSKDPALGSDDEPEGDSDGVRKVPVPVRAAPVSGKRQRDTAGTGSEADSDGDDTSASESRKCLQL